MNYQLLGRLPPEKLQSLKQFILNRMKPVPWQVIYDDFLQVEFAKLFNNTNIEIDADGKNQKVFVAAPGHLYGIHKDGIDKKSALNIAISCNETDWVRWYTDSAVEYAGGELKVFNDQQYRMSREISLDDSENVPFMQQVNTQEGDVYLINTDVYHSFKCVGNNHRFILQTKFAGNPSFDQLVEKITAENFNGIRT
jgi:hypothetical protein